LRPCRRARAAVHECRGRVVRGESISESRSAVSRAASRRLKKDSHLDCSFVTQQITVGSCCIRSHSARYADAMHERVVAVSDRTRRSRGNSGVRAKRNCRASKAADAVSAEGTAAHFCRCLHERGSALTRSDRLCRMPTLISCKPTLTAAARGTRWKRLTPRPLRWVRMRRLPALRCLRMLLQLRAIWSLLAHITRLGRRSRGLELRGSWCALFLYSQLE
jgi:hypothetical protein